mmetsp:Transcript_5902/g.9580  ORF Transcript_5902/g.9580 Transcript_5902/m.9580 type:complete len:135 (+) Transcript_5902:1298-1702(+)
MEKPGRTPDDTIPEEVKSKCLTPEIRSAVKSRFLNKIISRGINYHISQINLMRSQLINPNTKARPTSLERDPKDEEQIECRGSPPFPEQLDLTSKDQTFEGKMQKIKDMGFLNQTQNRFFGSRYKLSGSQTDLK